MLLPFFIARPCLLRPWQSQYNPLSLCEERSDEAIAVPILPSLPVLSSLLICHCEGAVYATAVIAFTVLSFPCHSERSDEAIALPILPSLRAVGEATSIQPTQSLRGGMTFADEAISPLYFFFLVIARPCLLRPWQSPLRFCLFLVILSVATKQSPFPSSRH